MFSVKRFESNNEEIDRGSTIPLGKKRRLDDSDSKVFESTHTEASTPANEKNLSSRRVRISTKDQPQLSITLPLSSKNSINQSLSVTPISISAKQMIAEKKLGIVPTETYSSEQTINNSNHQPNEPDEFLIKKKKMEQKRLKRDLRKEREGNEEEEEEEEHYNKSVSDQHKLFSVEEKMEDDNEFSVSINRKFSTEHKEVDLTILKNLRNNTKATLQLNSTSVPPINKKPIFHSKYSQIATSLINPTTPLKLDPSSKSIERQLRKRARSLRDRKLTGENVEVEEEKLEAERIEMEKKEVVEKKKLKQRKSKLNNNLSQTPNSFISTNDNRPSRSLINEEKRLASRPDWMHHGKKIDLSITNNLSSISVHPTIVSTLKLGGITNLFATQLTVIPSILSNNSKNDICVSSPTGSGKTLTYLVPLLHLLSTRTIIRLRLLILVPSRDLALQVYNECKRLSDPLDLKVGLAIGTTSLVKEQRSLLKKRAKDLAEQAQVEWDELLDLMGMKPLPQPYISASISPASFDSNRYVYDSLVDTLIATPGRLIDHLNLTPGFTLSYLRYFVIDEVDRLLTEHYQDWARVIWEATEKNVDTNKEIQEEEREQLPTTAVDTLDTTFPATSSTVGHPWRCQKLLFSATLTGDPSKLSSLHLNNPLFYAQESSEHRKLFSIPAGLKGYFYLCKPSEKPFLLIHILHSLNLQTAKTKPSSTLSLHLSSTGLSDQVLVFTSSLETTHRLGRLLSLYGRFSTSAYSSLLSQSSRTSVLEAFRARSLSVLICTDVMSRGIDIPSVTHIINYDTPISVQTYLHRIGRTARGGAEGKAISLVKWTENKSFISMCKKANNSYVERCIIDNEKMELEEKDEIERYKLCLTRLGSVLREERMGQLSRSTLLTPIEEKSGKVTISSPIIDANEGAEAVEEVGFDAEEWKFTGWNQKKDTRK